MFCIKYFFSVPTWLRFNPFIFPPLSISFFILPVTQDDVDMDQFREAAIKAGYEDVANYYSKKVLWFLDICHCTQMILLFALSWGKCANGFPFIACWFAFCYG